MAVIRSRDNARIVRWRRLLRDAKARRAERKAMIEGPHLLDAWMRLRGEPASVIVSETAWADAGARSLLDRLAREPVIVSDGVMLSIADARTPQGIVAEVVVPEPAATLADAPRCVFLDGIQDAGNLGTILRSACAFGVREAVAGPGCADPWSPKVLRSGAGAHAALNLHEAADLADAMRSFGGRVLCASPVGGVPLGEADLGGRVGWIFGAEGHGVRDELARLASGIVSIPISGAAESLNVASAAAICLYETFRRGAQ